MQFEFVHLNKISYLNVDEMLILSWDENYQNTIYLALTKGYMISKSEWGDCISSQILIR